MTKHLTLILFIGLAWGQSDLSIKEEAVLDAKGDAKKWLAYPPLALISAGGLGTATFFVGEDIFDMPDELALLPSIFVGSFGAVISYNLFSGSDKKVLVILVIQMMNYMKKYIRRNLKKESFIILLHHPE